MLKMLWKDESAQDLIEYSLLLALVAMLAVAGFPPLSAALKAVFAQTTACITTPAGCGQ